MRVTCCDAGAGQLFRNITWRSSFPDSGRLAEALISFASGLTRKPALTALFAALLTADP